MKRAGLFLGLGLTLTASAFLSAGTGCGGTGGTTGTGGTSTSTSTHASTTAASTSTSGGTGGGAATLDCTSYCTEIIGNCTGAQQQYGASATDNGMANCMGFCGTLASKGTLADTTGNTLGCRLYHAGAPAKMLPATHCPHAGPSGGDMDPAGANGTCGEPCDAFCDGAIALCTGANVAFADKPTCMTACKAFKADTVPYSEADQGTNDMGCRIYHLTAAAAGAAAATTHCPHIGTTSPVCKN
jgi:hypothetical protein